MKEFWTVVLRMFPDRPQEETDPAIESHEGTSEFTAGEVTIRLEDNSRGGREEKMMMMILFFFAIGWMEEFVCPIVLGRDRFHEMQMISQGGKHNDGSESNATKHQDTNSDRR